MVFAAAPAPRCFKKRSRAGCSDGAARFRRLGHGAGRRLTPTLSTYGPRGRRAIAVHVCHDGVESALAQARQAAGDKDVGISGSTIVQQCLQAGWLDEIDIHLAHVLLGAGVRLFDHLGTQPRALEILRVVATPDVTHLRYRVLK
jgi:hypothetical protein